MSGETWTQMVFLIGVAFGGAIFLAGMFVAMWLQNRQRDN
jgi:hypothetical protein